MHPAEHNQSFSFTIRSTLIPSNQGFEGYAPGAVFARDARGQTDTKVQKYGYQDLKKICGKPAASGPARYDAKYILGRQRTSNPPSRTPIFYSVRIRSRNSPTDTALPGIKTMGSKLLTGCGAILLALVPAVATAREISPSISSSIFDRSGHQSQPPLAVLRIGGPSGGDQAVPPPELEIFAEDPRWAYKVRGSRRVVYVV